MYCRSMTLAPDNVRHTLALPSRTGVHRIASLMLAARTVVGSARGAGEQSAV